MIPTPFLAVPDWFSWENQGLDLDTADLDHDGRPDLVLLTVDHAPQQNRGLYRLGHALDATGAPTGGWTPWLDVPDWFSRQTQGAGVAVGDLTGTGRTDLVVLMVDDGPQQNRGVYRIGRGLDPATGEVSAGWSDWVDVPDWFSWENQGASLALADLTGSGHLDLIVAMVDNGPERNRGLFRIGHDLDPATGTVTGGWTGWIDVPDWYSWENQDIAVTVADLTGSGSHDLVVLGVDNPIGQNQAYYRVASGLDGQGVPAGGWSSLLGVNNWYSWENQGAGIAVADLGSGPELIVAAVDAPPGLNEAFLGTVALREDPAVHGTWEVLPFSSQVLAIHAALLRTGKVLFFAGSGNNQVRDASPDLGNIAAGLYTSVVWDPAGATFDHPPTLRRMDGRIYDYFCCGHSALPDGRLFVAGGNQSYNDGNNLGQRESASFDPVTETWSARPPMAHGRWYPTLVTLPDGRVLTVSGKNDTNGDLNAGFEVYDPATDTWGHLNPPANFVGLPFYAHLFPLGAGRVFFSGGRMDDGRPQQSGTLHLGNHAVTFQPAQGAEVDATLRNQSSSVLLPPAQQHRVMLIGGGMGMENMDATGHTEIIDAGADDNRWGRSMPLSLPRIHLNAVILPDRTILVSGGAIAHEGTDAPIPRLQAEIYHPETDRWSPAAVAKVVRLYHSVALLLPDGRVAAASGNPPPYGHLAPWEPPQANEELRLEIYRPPYLFAPSRPEIGQVAEQWTFGQRITIGSPQAGNLLWAQLISPGATTHAFDCDQRLVDLPIVDQGGGQLEVDAPASADEARPGWYMLTVVDQQRVPSVATWVHLGP
ncbi:galactose oxidase-like domain-containing protein [Raineyella fluvialis]|uniref:DUF1929 domain-containing protein n=1 Tax=Raineyella fluvialis TaxID=2662261 RepID=A0A5Q2FAS3_9ACTN|nr:galactose oxidase-like domain-containing protein [Raineyella fluvialis]QGF23798.1 DUF1929 domain-containing protein [Raineyella fluvialis]